MAILAHELGRRHGVRSKRAIITWSDAYQSYHSAGDEAEPFCMKCDNLLENDFKYCPNCGSELDWMGVN